MEVLQFEYQLQAASCNNCKQLDKALSLEQVEVTFHQVDIEPNLYTSDLRSRAISAASSFIRLEDKLRALWVEQRQALLLL